MAADYRDLVIEMLAADEARALERLTSVEADRDAFQLVARQALHALHHLTQSHARLRRSHARLLDEYRTVRQAVAA